MGSSGNSTGPHLHLELYDGDGNLVEPFAGPCNTLNPRSRWRTQRPYHDSVIDRLLVGDAPVSYPSCPGRAVTNEVSSVVPGTVACFTAFYRDQLGTQTSQYRVPRPDGSVFRSWSHSSSSPHYAASWWWWSWFLPAGAPSGTWTFEVTYAGRTYAHAFQAG